MALSGGEIALLLILTIIGIIVVVFLFWYFLLRKNGNSTGEHCTINSDCEPGHYCGGGDQCVIGLCGGPLGSICKKNADCEVGLLCVSGRCSEGTAPLVPLGPTGPPGPTGPTGTTGTTGTTGPTGTAETILVSRLRLSGMIGTDENPITSFNDRLIVVHSIIRDHSEYYYLDVSSTGSRWVAEPRHSFSYNHRTNTLTATNLHTNISAPVTISLSGQLVTTIGSNQDQVVITDNGEGLVMKDRYGNELSVGECNFYPIAVFKQSVVRPAQYPDQDLRLKAIPVLFQVTSPFIDLLDTTNLHPSLLNLIQQTGT